MKAKITIENFDNGITLRWENEEGHVGGSVAMDYDKEKAIGKTIWEDVYHIMKDELTLAVELNIEYKAVK